MGFGRLGVFEIALIFVVILLIFGPSRLPEIGKSIGKAFREFRQGVDNTIVEKEESDEKKQ